MSASGPLARRRIVVTRAADQAGTLSALLAEAGAHVIEVPTIAIVEPPDGGVALIAAVVAAAHPAAAYDWIVVTSGNGASRLVGAARAAGLSRSDLGAQIAVVGPGTADVLGAYGWPVDLVPERFVGEGLVDAFGEGPGRVLVAQAEAARPVVVDGLRAKGWTVDVVIAYRTIPAVLDAALVAEAAAADAITFTSSSTVANYLQAAGATNVPAVVVCIGPVTAATARERGLAVAAVAVEHSLPGLVIATVSALEGS